MVASMSTQNVSLTVEEVAMWLNDRLGQPVMVEIDPDPDRGGASMSCQFVGTLENDNEVMQDDEFEAFASYTVTGPGATFASFGLERVNEIYLDGPAVLRVRLCEHLWMGISQRRCRP